MDDGDHRLAGGVDVVLVPHVDAGQRHLRVRRQPEHVDGVGPVEGLAAGVVLAKVAAVLPRGLVGVQTRHDDVVQPEFGGEAVEIADDGGVAVRLSDPLKQFADRREANSIITNRILLVVLAENVFKQEPRHILLRLLQLGVDVAADGGDGVDHQLGRRPRQDLVVLGERLAVNILNFLRHVARVDQQRRHQQLDDLGHLRLGAQHRVPVVPDPQRTQPGGADDTGVGVDKHLFVGVVVDDQHHQQLVGADQRDDLGALEVTVVDQVEGHQPRRRRHERLEVVGKPQVVLGDAELGEPLDNVPPEAEVVAGDVDDGDHGVGVAGQKERVGQGADRQVHVRQLVPQHDALDGRSLRQGEKLLEYAHGGWL